jgi:D-3-phosphoglycerate dehydrogenase / 2-oxoglutarate reductase
MSDDARRTVVVTYPAFDEDDPRTAGVLRAAGLEIRYEPRVGERTTDEVLAFMADATAGVVSTDPFDRKVFGGCPRLRVLARVGVGVDTIDLEAATEAGVAVTTTPGINTNTVADHTLALILACVRRVVENDASVRRGEWDRGGRLIGIELAGSTVGIVGLGAIGRAVARRVGGFDARILGCDVVDVDTPGVERVGLDDLLRSSDVVTVHVPLGAGTRTLIGARELGLMRPGAILVNTSRGGIVDEQALHDALRAGRLGGAGIDVFEREPPGAELLGLDRVVVSPHVAGISVVAQQESLELAVSSVLAVLEGGRPAGLVNPAVLAGVREPAFD